MGVPEEEREREEEKAYLKKSWQKISQIWRKIWTARYMKFLSPLQIQPKEDCTKIHYSKFVKIKDKQSILKAPKDTHLI